MFITPGGNPALTVSSANFRAVIGVTCEIEIEITLGIDLVLLQQET